jgi:hypothetical protein
VNKTAIERLQELEAHLADAIHLADGLDVCPFTPLERDALGDLRRIADAAYCRELMLAKIAETAQ